MEFSRLDDTKFPHLDTASPYALKNTFDYTRWVPNTKIHLVNVLWNGDYANVVKFEDDEARDRWFDGIEDAYALTLTSNARMVPDGSIKLPLPYDVASRYNYLFVDIPLATSKDAPIQDETEAGVRRWYFFVGDVSYSAPNTTVMYLQPDIWTNFIDGARLTYMMLERGHAPVAASDTDTYLANPIANNRYLLAPDVNFDDATVVRDSKYVPVGSGTKYILLASTMGYEQIERAEAGEVKAGTDFTDPTYSDMGAWYGYQLQVNGYGFGNGRDYSDLRACVNMYNRPGAIMPTSLDVYAVPADDWNFLSEVREKSPAFLRTIKAMFVASEDMFTVERELTFVGHKIYFVLGARRELGGYPLTRSMFGFDADEQRFAKLYTYPYSRIEVSDNSGHTSEVRIENTSGIGTEMLVSVAFPILDCRIYLTGVNGVGSQSYVWRNLSGDDMAREVPNGDWDQLLFDLDIPTFALYLDAETSYVLDSYSGAFVNAREQALAAYHNAIRSANLGYTNGVASAQNAHDNSVRAADTAQSNSNAAADTAQTNSNAAAATGNANARASAATANTNAVNSANTAQTNGNASATTQRTNTNNIAQTASDNANLSITAMTANTERSILAASTIAGYSAAQALTVTNAANSVNYNTTKEENEVSIATTKNAGQATMTTATIGAVASVGSAALTPSPTGIVGSIISGVAGVANAGVSTACANTNASIVAQTNASVATLNNAANTTTRVANTQFSGQSTMESNDSKREQNDNSVTCMQGQRDNNYNTNTTNATNAYNTATANNGRTQATATGNANRTLSTSNANADRTRDTSVANAGRTHDTTVANAGRTHSTSVSNADATLSTSNANSARSREVGILNAKETLEATQDTAMHGLHDARRGTPTQLTPVTGDGANMYHGQNGIQFRLRTQSDSAIAQTAAQFARYGYALNQIWDVGRSGLNLMRHFTYWKAADVWVDVRNVASSEVGDAIQRMFEEGVTVWRDPDEIGKVGIYDN